MKRILIIAIGLFMMAWFGLKHEHHQAGSHKEIWYCPMHTQYISDRPGSCPICAMSLVKRVEGLETNPAASHQGQVKIDLEKQPLMGLRLAQAKRQNIVKKIRTYGYVSTAMEIYELQNEFIDAYVDYAKAFRNFRHMSDQARVWSPHRNLQTRMLEAKNKLLKLGLGEAELEKLQNVSWNNVSQQPLLQLFKENRNYWVIAQIFEQDLGFVDVGQEVQIHIPAFHEDTKGIIRSVGGVIDTNTRTVNALVELTDYRGDLVANMLVDLLIPVELQAGLLVPLQALMDTGAKKIVYVQTSETSFEPREIKPGWDTGEYVQILSGLKEGDMVVVDGNFLLDSESRLQGAFASVNSKGADEAGGHNHGQ